MYFKVMLAKHKYEYYPVPIKAETPQEAELLAREIAEQKRLAIWDLLETEEEWEVLEVTPASKTDLKCAAVMTPPFRQVISQPR